MGSNPIARGGQHVADVQIDPAVTVVVPERDGHAGPKIDNASHRSHIDKAPIVVSIKTIRSVVVRDIQIPIRLIAVNGGGPSHPDRVAAFASAAGAITVHWVEGHHDIHAEQPQVVADILIELAREVGS